MADADTAYEALISNLRQIALLGSIGSVLGWDERTQLPVKGTAHRADQASMLAAMVHQRFTAPRIGDLLSTLETSPLMTPSAGDASVNIRETRRAYDRACKLPESWWRK